MRMLHEQNTLVNLFKANIIPFVIIKGTAAAVYFPSPASRTYGDIDIYLSEEHFEFAKSLLESNGYKYIDDEDRHYEYIKNGIYFGRFLKYVFIWLCQVSGVAWGSLISSCSMRDLLGMQDLLAVACRI